MPKLDEIIEELREQGRDDDVEELEKLRGSTLRQKAARAEQLEKEVTDLKAENEGLKRGPKVTKAFKDAGVDLDSLSKLERKAIEAYDGELEEDAIAAFLEENEISVADASDEEDKDDEPAAAKVAKAARRSNEDRGGSKTPKVSPADVAEWGMEKSLAFAEANPDAWEALKRGETVTGVKVPA